jgi:hypothetical protein
MITGARLASARLRVPRAPERSVARTSHTMFSLPARALTVAAAEKIPSPEVASGPEPPSVIGFQEESELFRNRMITEAMSE